MLMSQEDLYHIILIDLAQNPKIHRWLNKFRSDFAQSSKVQKLFEMIFYRRQISRIIRLIGETAKTIVRHFHMQVGVVCSADDCVIEPEDRIARCIQPAQFEDIGILRVVVRRVLYVDFIKVQLFLGYYFRVKGQLFMGL
jgi:hypothetical protein